MKFQTKENTLQNAIPAQQISDQSGYAEILQRMESGHQIAITQAMTIVKLASLVLYTLATIVLFSIWPTHFAWNVFVVLFVCFPILIASVMGFGYYIFHLKRWNRMITAIRTFDFNLDGIPDSKPGIRNLVITVKRGEGNYQAAHTQLDEKFKSSIIVMAKLYFHRRYAPQAECENTWGIPRTRWEQINNEVFLELGLVKKEGSHKNAQLVRIESPETLSILRDLSEGNFAELDELWSGGEE